MSRRLLFPALVAATALAGCHDTRRASGDPPAGLNVCWRVDVAGAGEVDAVAYGVPSLEQCAIFIEGLRLEEHHAVTGVWNGVYIHADARDVTASVKSHNERYPIFRPSDRAKIDANLSLQIALKNGAATSSSTSSHRRGGLERNEIELIR